MNKLRKTKSLGLDIFLRVRKKTKYIICEPLIRVFLIALDSGEVPSFWKKANNVPLFKMEDKSSMPNYRPIRLTRIFYC